MLFFSFQGYSDIWKSTLLLKYGDFDIWYSLATFRLNFSFQVYAAPLQWRLLIYIEKNLWHRVLKANKKQVPLKSYCLESRIDSVNQILKNKEKVIQTRNRNISLRTRIADWKIQCVCIRVYQIIKNWTPGPYKSIIDNRKYVFGSLSNAKSKGSTHVLLGEGRWKNLDMFLLRKVNFIMINEFRYG